MRGNSNKAMSLCCGLCSIDVTAAESRDNFSGYRRNTTKLCAIYEQHEMLTKCEFLLFLNIF